MSEPQNRIAELDVELLRLCKKAKKVFHNDKFGERYLKDGMNAFALNEIAIKSQDNRIVRAYKKMNNILREANEIFEKEIGKFDELNEKLLDNEKTLAESTKRAVGKVKSSVSNLSDSIAKIEKTANFDRLERYAATLESIAKSLDKIAELNKSGKIESVIKALNN